MNAMTDPKSASLLTHTAKQGTIVAIALIFILITNFAQYDAVGSFLYILVVATSGKSGDRRWIQSVALGCAFLTVLEFELLGGSRSTLPAEVCLATLFSISVIAFLVLENKDKKDILLVQRQLLSRSQTLLESTQRLGSIGSIIFSFPSLDMQWSAEAKRIFLFQNNCSPMLSDLLGSIHADDHDLVLHNVQELRSHRSDVDVEFRITLAGQKTKTLRLVARPSGSEDLKCDAVVILIDVTSARESENDFQQRQSEAAGINRVMTFNEIIGSIAHEVNQPLAAVVTSAESGLRWLDRACPDTAEVDLALRRVVEQTDRASAFMKTLKGRSLDRPRVPEPVCISDIFNSAHRFLMREARLNDVNICFQVNDDIPLVAADQTQLQHVLINLITNSIEAVSLNDGGRVREVTVVACRSISGGLSVSIRDSGAGVLEEDVKKLFTPFFSTKVNGVGIGLATCRSVIEAHGGRIWAATDQQTGAIFNFFLPQFGRVSI